MINLLSQDGTFWWDGTGDLNHKQTQPFKTVDTNSHKDGKIIYFVYDAHVKKINK